MQSKLIRQFNLTPEEVTNIITEFSQIELKTPSNPWLDVSTLLAGHSKTRVPKWLLYFCYVGIVTTRALALDTIKEDDKQLDLFEEKKEPKGFVIHLEEGVSLEVAPKELEVCLSWYDAVNYCQNLEGGWRLPTKEELNVMYSELHEKGLDGFAVDAYWSSSEYSSYDAWRQDFYYGYQYDSSKDRNYYVRPVRVLKQGVKN